MFNGLQKPTFGSFKMQKELINSTIKTSTAKKYEYIPTSFKQIKELKENNAPKYCYQTSNKKTLQNQQNTFSNIIFDQASSAARKNLIKMDKSVKKHNNFLSSKSPSHQNFEAIQIAIKSKIMQNSHYNPKIIVSKHEQNANLMTPYICKTNRSVINHQNYRNNTIINVRQKNEQNSETESISISSKASFKGSFPNLSCQEDSFTINDKSSSVNSSVEFLIQPPNGNNNNFDPPKINFNAMKKSMHVELSTKDSIKEYEFLLPKLSESVSSSFSSNVGSINFTEKFKHYKREHQKVNIERKLKLEQFKIIEEIGSGKYGKVFLAKHQQTGFICALKSVSKRLIKEENLQTPFMRQVKIQMYLNHPNIIKLYGLFQDADNVYLIMEYCSGNHLFKLIKQRKQFQYKQIIQILGNIFEAVSFLHCNGIIHRDIKPENIVIQNGVYKLCDFGWAAYTCGDNRTTFCGTPLYVCPEVLKGQQYNSKVDIWGLGIIAYELTFGRVPFSITNKTDLSKIVKDPVYFPNWNNSSSKLIPFIEQMLNKNPDKRPSLNEILSGEDFRKFNQNLKGPLRQQLDKLF